MTAYLRDLIVGLGPELTIVTAIVFGGLAIVALFNLWPLSWAWMHEALGDEPRVPHQVDLTDDQDENDRRLFEAIARVRNTLLDDVTWKPADDAAAVPRTPLPAVSWKRSEESR
jgi:hypothetical protein